MRQRSDRLNPDIMQAVLLAAPGEIFEDRTRLQAGLWLLGRLGLDHRIRHWTCEGAPSADAIRDELAAGIAQGRIGRELHRAPGRPVVETFRALRAPGAEPLSAPGLSSPQLRRAVYLMHAASVLDVTLAAIADWIRAHDKRHDWRGHAMDRVSHRDQGSLEGAAGLLRDLGIDSNLAEVAGAPPGVD